MLLHENERCPVCDELFKEDDDIVICHMCGTPHHRDCYYSLGHCANADKHGEDFSYNSSASSAQESDAEKEPKDSSNSGAYYNSQLSDKKTVCKGCGAEIEKSAPFCYNCGAKQSSPVFDKAEPLGSPFAVHSQPEFEENEEMLDGKRVKDIAATVKTNCLRFINIFKKGKKASWNWGGFFFGAYYLFFRKMYKQGIIALAAEIIPSIVIQGLFIEQISAFTNIYSSYSSIMSSGADEAKIQEFLNQAMPALQAVYPALIMLLAIRLIINIVVAIFADGFYKTKVLSIIDKVDKNIEEGASFGQFGIMSGEINISQEQMRTLYLNKTGGTSILIPIIAYAAVNLLSSIISNL